jgi:hypothetical protein
MNFLCKEHNIFDIKLSDTQETLIFHLKLRYLAYKVIVFKLNLMKKWFEDIKIEYLKTNQCL